jgi:DNA-binding response OmpR family regulator
MSGIDVLVAVLREDASRYYKSLSANKDFRLQIVSDQRDALDILDNKDDHVDVVVLDNRLGGIFDFVSELRHSYPRLFIVLVDEEADFATPGQADEISTDPFENDDLIKRITRLMSDRQLETLRADSMPAVRDFAKRLRKATGESGKQQAAVSACMDMDYQYVAFYYLEGESPLRLTLRAQEGPSAIQSVAPKQAGDDDLIGWVAQTGQSRIAGPTDDLTHPLVQRGRMGAVACMPVHASGHRYGVLVACREIPDSITQDNVLMLELVSAQLGAAVAQEIIT